MFQLWMALSIVGLVGLDRLTKIWAAAALADHAVTILPGVFELQLTYNDGAAFSMLSGQRWFLILLPAVVSVVVLAVLFSGRFRREKLVNIGCALIAAGGIGNLIDRVFTGRVIDFLYFKLINFPIFNFADCCVVIGAVLIVVFLLFFYEESEKAKPDAKGEDETDDHLSAGTGGEEN